MQIEPLALTVGLAVEQLYALNGTRALDEIGVLLRPCPDADLIEVAEFPVGDRYFTVPAGCTVNFFVGGGKANKMSEGPVSDWVRKFAHPS